MIRNILLTLILCLTSTLALAQEAPPASSPPVPAATVPAAVPVPDVPAVAPAAVPVAVPDVVSPVATEPVAAVSATAPEPAPVVLDSTTAEPSSSPTVTEVVEGVGTVVDAYRVGGWLAALAALVVLLTALVRKVGWLDELPKRLRVLIPLVFGCLAAGLYAAAAGAGWLEALCLALLTGPSAIALHQGIARSLLGLDSPETKQLKQAAGQ